MYMNTVLLVIMVSFVVFALLLWMLIVGADESRKRSMKDTGDNKYDQNE